TVEAQAAAGIMMVVAAGNSGSSCSTTTDPPSFYAASYTAGALNTGTDTIASFSSRGPVTIDGSNRLKPDITAPGTNTRSAPNTYPDTYAYACTDHAQRREAQGGGNKYSASHLERGDLNQHRRLP